jgi:hypothetical protein
MPLKAFFLTIKSRIMKRMMLAVMGSILMGVSAGANVTNEKVVTNPLHSVRVTDLSGMLDGVLEVRQFIPKYGKLWAICKLKGTLGGLPIDKDCEVPVNVGDCLGGNPREIALPEAGPMASFSDYVHCECLEIEFEHCLVPGDGGVVELMPSKVQCTVENYPGDLLCEINGGINEIGATAEKVAYQLNRLL